MTATVRHADCMVAMREMPAASVDAVVTDPPYGLGFMGEAWDMLPPGEEWARECLRVLKPGGHLLAFGGPRTWHRLATAIEDAGFELRDSLMWLYGSGFPKSLNVAKAIDKTKRRDYVLAAVALGMAIPARNLDDWTKEGHSPGDRWWDEFRAHISPADWQAIERRVVGQGRSGAASVAYTRETGGAYAVTAPATADAAVWDGWGTALKPAFEPVVVARKPLGGTVAANVLAHGTGALNVAAGRVDGGRWPPNVALDETAAAAVDTVTDGASRFFYVAKASRGERPAVDGVTHPTVKPLALMRWLVRLVTPPGGVVLDPFAGSGTTAEACLAEGFACIAIEREARYLPLIEARLTRAKEAA